MKSPQTPPLDDENAERARQRHVECLLELQGSPLARATIVSDVALANATEVTVAHNLGRVPVFVTASIPRGASSAGRIDDLTRERSIDRKRFLVLMATGYGATVNVDLAVL